MQKDQKTHTHVDSQSLSQPQATGGRNEAVRCSVCDQEVPDIGDLVCVDCYDTTRRELPDPVVLRLTRNDCYLLLGYLATRKRPAWLMALYVRFFDALDAASSSAGVSPEAGEAQGAEAVPTDSDAETQVEAMREKESS